MRNAARMLRVALRIVAVCLISSLAVVSAFAQDASPERLGTNLDGVVDYSPQVPFTDIFLNSREWLTQCEVGRDPGCSSGIAFDTGESEQINLDSNGWVKSLPTRAAAPIFTSVATIWDLPSSFPKGRFVVLYEGEGTIEYGLGARKVTDLSRVGRDVIDVEIAGGGIFLKIVATDPQHAGNYVRSIRVVAEKDEARLVDNRFSESFVEGLAPYQALRFMDWARTNNSVVTTWGMRAQPTDARYSTAKGVPVEVMVELANVAGKTTWFNMPHQATDDYVAHFASVVKNALAPQRSVYVEYSNEVWNSGFSQGDWVQAQGESEWPSSPESGFTKRMNWYGKRSAEICDIWRGVFSDSPERVVCVIASQAANSWTASEALSCPLWSGAPCKSHGITALAIAPYMGDYLGQEESGYEVSHWSLTRLFSELNSGGELSSGPSGGAKALSLSWVADNLSVARNFGVQLVAYEGGQHLVGVGGASSIDALTDLFTKANRDPRIGDLYTDFLQGWESLGGGLFMHFTDIGSYSRYGSWGALEEIGQSTSPKYAALWLYSLGTPQPRSAIPRRTLRVRKRGRGEVVSSPAGLRCGTRCGAQFASGRTITLTARPSRGYRFFRWLGACTHSRSKCRVSLSRSDIAVAVFAR